MSGKTKGDELEDLSSNNPLSLNDHNPWQQYFADTEMRRIIQQDVERTFPDIDFFRQQTVQQHLTDILFIYCKLNRKISYRQGMHELLAPFYWALQTDSVDLSISNDQFLDPTVKLMVQVLDSQYVEHDAYILFEKLMKSAKTWYDFNDDAATSERKPMGGKNKYRSELLSEKVPRVEETARLSPIVMICHQIHHQHLRTVDPTLYKHLESFSIEPQLYGLRWIRLLFGREFDFYELLKLWDAIFAQSPSLDIVEYICVVMLLRIRDQLLQKDYAECLSLLMRPLPNQYISKPASIVEQAKLLMDNPSTDTALQILQQMDLRSGKEPRLTLEVERSASIQSNYTSQHNGNRVRSSSAAASSPIISPPMLQHKSSSQGFENFARNMMKNPQVRDLNKAIAGVMGTVQKNVNAFGNRYQQQQEFSSEFPPSIDRIMNAKNTTAVKPNSIDQQSLLTYNQPFASTSSVDAISGLSKHMISSSQLRQLGDMLAKCINILEDEMFPPVTPPSSKSFEEKSSKDTVIKSIDITEKANKEKELAEQSTTFSGDGNGTEYSSKMNSEDVVPTVNEDVQLQKQQQRRDAKLVMTLVGLKHIRDILNGKQTHFDPSIINIDDYNNDVNSNDELKNSSSPLTKDDWQMVNHPTISPNTSGIIKDDDATPCNAATSSTKMKIAESVTHIPSSKKDSSFQQQLIPTAEKTTAEYVPRNPTPFKKPIKYRIEDLISDSDLNPITTSNKLKWMLTPRENSNSTNSSSSGSGSCNNSSKTLFGNTKSSEKITDPSAILKKKKSHSFILTWKQSANETIEEKSTGSSDGYQQNTLDPLDAKNVDSKKFYDDGF
ncbi:hypothetical protein BDF20DRAFT_857996 [Mycotypha africana]|uniref:uncharacterized protein n=1 Tax=Mycotypha africana TaxID=64632 RepID=UPI00230119A5|nr:uncharacterized protein BDF20DRAFT_857996 [Mycotypha africana]KAI8984111.1 hypothetical protein BDF20DRAFT_857996 [Mycotypha africana]